jgi:YfiH family protein
MQRFSYIETLGTACAAMSDATDGDCSIQAPDAAGRAAFLAKCNANPAALVYPKQVHGIEIVLAENTNEPNPTADGILTQTPGLPIGITIADCVPIFLLDPIRRIVGLAHAGREGTYQAIAKALVEKAQTAFDANPADLHAIIGPSGGPCCYEVSPEIAARFKAAQLPTQDRHLDLWAANHQQLTDAGLDPENIKTTEQCTICDQSFYSFRREDTTARNLALMIL